MNKEQNIVAICGMHRSGTSLLASWLRACGLNIGSEFFGPTYGNRLGHFEDLEFLNLQIDIFESNHIDFAKCTTLDINISRQQHARAEQLLDRRKNLEQWGWKDPRTCLLLDFWREKIPGLKMIGIYRPYVAVVHSLLRRARRKPQNPLRKVLADLWHHPRNRFLIDRYVGSWIAFNSSILRFCQEHPEDAIICSVSDLVDHSDSICNFLMEEWKLNLTYIDLHSLFDPNAMTDVEGKGDLNASSALSKTAGELLGALALERRFQGSWK